MSSRYLTVYALRPHVRSFELNTGEASANVGGDERLPPL